MLEGLSPVECALAWVVLLLAAGCSGSTAGASSSGAGGAAGNRGDGAGAGGTPVIDIGDAGALGGLHVHVEKDGVVVDVITLACAGNCADVEAVASGGHPPYTFAWEDGSTGPTHHVCPSETRRYNVSVTDHGVQTGEIRHDPVTVTAAVTADVLDCRGGPHPLDAGARGDSGPTRPDAGGACVSMRPDGCDDIALSVAAGRPHPCDAWSYGWQTSPDGPLNTYDLFFPASATAAADPGGGGLFVWASSASSATGYVPDLLFNPGSAALPAQGSFKIPPMAIALRPGPGEASVVRWSARAAGTYDVAATFTGLAAATAPTTSYVRIVHGGVDEDAGRINYGSSPENGFRFTTTLMVDTAGDTIDFVVDTWDATVTTDATSLVATVCPASSP